MTVLNPRGIAGAALGALLLLAGTGAYAQETEEHRTGECREARRICHHAARHAVRACADACESGEEGATCRDECRRIFHAARSLCREEVRECIASLRPPLDEACATECREDFALCRDDLGECRDECRDETRDAVRDCVEMFRDDGDRQAFHACVHEAHREGHLCGQDCYDEYPCGHEFRECLTGCVIE